MQKVIYALKFLALVKTIFQEFLPTYCGDLKILFDYFRLFSREKLKWLFSKIARGFCYLADLTHWPRYGGIRDGAKQLFEGEGGLN